MVVCVECLSADKPWDVVSVTRRSSGVAPQACVRVRVCARVPVPPNLYIHTYIYPPLRIMIQVMVGAPARTAPSPNATHCDTGGGIHPLSNPTNSNPSWYRWGHPVSSAT